MGVAGIGSQKGVGSVKDNLKDTGKSEGRMKVLRARTEEDQN